MISSWKSPQYDFIQRIANDRWPILSIDARKREKKGSGGGGMSYLSRFKEANLEGLASSAIGRYCSGRSRWPKPSPRISGGFYHALLGTLRTYCSLKVDITTVDLALIKMVDQSKSSLILIFDVLGRWALGAAVCPRRICLPGISTHTLNT